VSPCYTLMRGRIVCQGARCDCKSLKGLAGACCCCSHRWVRNTRQEKGTRWCRLFSDVYSKGVSVFRQGDTRSLEESATGEAGEESSGRLTPAFRRMDSSLGSSVDRDRAEVTLSLSLSANLADPGGGGVS
jgi:hypothetical protein